jgi:hydrogenase expression/formation protein HypD
VFFAIGFETTTPPTAVAIRQAQREELHNFSVYCNHVLTPPALRALLAGSPLSPPAPLPPGERGVAEIKGQIDGFIGPAHVSTVIGSQPYEFVAADYQRPLVIAGFEPLDVLQAILMLIRQLNAGEIRVDNEYTRAVNQEGNRKAQRLMDEVFTTRSTFEWRGLGELPDSALMIRPEFADWDAERRFAIPEIQATDHKACVCAEVLRGITRPEECKVFATACTPDHPLGSCMVSAEGACAAHYHYGRFRQAAAS